MSRLKAIAISLLCLFCFSALFLGQSALAAESQEAEVNEAEISEAPKAEGPLRVSCSYASGKLLISCDLLQANYRYSIQENDGEPVLFESESASYSFKMNAGINYTIEVEAEDDQTIYRSDIYTACLPQAAAGLKSCGISKKKVKLSWSKSEGADSYRIYRKINKSGAKYQKLAETNKRSYSAPVSYKNIYVFKVVPVCQSASIAIAGAGKTIAYNNVTIVSRNHRNYSYSEMAKDIKALSKKYNGLLQYRSLGKSCDNRIIYDVIVGNPAASRTFVVEGAIHGREYMATLLIMNQIEYYLENQSLKIGREKVSKTLNRVCIHFIPMQNPDGVTIAQSGISAIRDKKLRAGLKRIAGGSTVRWKANARGVDINRNWDVMWKRLGKRSLSGFSGTRPESEPETVASANLKRQLKKSGTLKGILSYHTVGNIVFHSVPGISKKVKKKAEKMYRLARSITGYADADTIFSVGGGYGNSMEWDMLKLKVPSTSIEVGRRSAPGPISEFPSIWAKNKTVVIREAQLLEND